MIFDQAIAGSQLQLKAELRHITPPIWRRLLIPAEMTLAELHQALQTPFG